MVIPAFGVLRTYDTNVFFVERDSLNRIKCSKMKALENVKEFKIPSTNMYE